MENDIEIKRWGNMDDDFMHPLSVPTAVNFCYLAIIAFSKVF